MNDKKKGKMNDGRGSSPNMEISCAIVIYNALLGSAWLCISSSLTQTN